MWCVLGDCHLPLVKQVRILLYKLFFLMILTRTILPPTMDAFLVLESQITETALPPLILRWLVMVYVPLHTITPILQQGVQAATHKIFKLEPPWRSTE